MFKAILFDLDGTLLNIDMDYFLKQYFRKMVNLASEMGYQEGNRLVEQVWRSTGVMIADKNPNITNEEAFMQDFYRNWPYLPKEFNNFFERYYQECFPLLKEFCQPFPEVPEMMEYVMNQGIKVVIATNAVFPLSALQNRIEWAGIGRHQFDLITSYEVMHFCKPHIEYYQEIAEKIGVKPEECLMVGNDTGEDLPAGQLGMKTFLVEDMLIDRGAKYKADWHGKIPKLADFIKSCI
ncbi:MAG: HAD family hydrolase [Syntrophomonadaceae bacterium]|jgi:HAD superfamily hydrolase (TIGR01549 family)